MTDMRTTNVKHEAAYNGLTVRRRARAMRQYMAPLPTPMVRDAFVYLMDGLAQSCHATDVGMACISAEQGYAGDGVLIWARMPNGTILEEVVLDDQTARALDAGLEWRYRLIGGPRVWNVRPLWMARDCDACRNLFMNACAKIARKATERWKA